jgi:long-subunit acyl-CoA synthetase (AMP-forming)
LERHQRLGVPDSQVTALSKGLVAAGIQPGDKIGLICRTRYEWTLLDFAVLVRRRHPGSGV